MKISDVCVRFLISKGVDPRKFVELCSSIKINGVISKTLIYNKVGKLEAEITSTKRCIYLEIEHLKYSYYDDLVGDTIIWLSNVSIPEVLCSKIVEAGKRVEDLIELGEENSFLKGCGTILSVKNDEFGVTVKLLPNWIEMV